MCMLFDMPRKLTKEEKRAIKMEQARAKTIELLPLDDYDVVIVSFSGGKDSLACVLDLIEKGVPRHKIQLWHQCVDGDPAAEKHFMDWPVTIAYCRAVAEHLGVAFYTQWREGGFHRELTKVNAMTAGVWFESQTGRLIYLKTGSNAKEETRGKFPQKGSDLRTRWCSPSLKIDVFARALANTKEFERKKILVLTGERAQESDNRALYAPSELHRCNAKKRLVHAWRPIHKWQETQVWEIIQRHGIVPHPAYYLGYSRVSCRNCIFLGPDGWATSREITPETVYDIAQLEEASGVTITKGLSVLQQADRGTVTIDYSDPYVVRQLEISHGMEYEVEWLAVSPEDWRLPSGAYKRGGGPT